jgi:diadenosine tetraphosphate (Ap4A) HIT family hydrolase
MSRFDNIIHGVCPARVYDSVLVNLGGMVVTPTLGSIVPHWVLAIPKKPFQNIVQWGAHEDAAPLEKLSKIIRHLGHDPSDVIWFEHGSTELGSITGCGIDHAHIHILLRPTFDFLRFKNVAVELSSLDWEELDCNPYPRIGFADSYLIAGSGNRFLLARSVESAGSQFFRRVVAQLVDKAETWNYRSHPYHENVELTVESYGHKAA